MNEEARDVDNWMVIPIHLDALRLDSDRLIAEAEADFSQLPYFDRKLQQEINFDTANISEEIVSQPFQSQNLNLKAGIHLHWALPDGLTRGLQTEADTKFPPVPNRWLVTRKRQKRIEAQWVVESDYLYPVEPRVPYPVGKGATSGAITYYFRDESDNNAPFRYMGRKMLLSSYLQDRTPPDHFLPEKQPLTAVGYGEATFAAFYPNCHSVFGFHDDAYSGEVKGLTYEVVGWYSRQDDLINFICAQWPRVSSSEIIDKDELLEVLQEEFQWSLPSITVQRSEFERFGNYDKLWQHLIDQGWLKQPNADVAVITPKYKRTNPKLNGDFQASEQDINDFLSSKIANQISERFLCYAQLTFEEQMGDRQDSLNDEELNARIAIGNTTMETLSALISYELRDGLDLNIKEQGIFEDQLESFHLTSAVDNHEIDIGAKFEAARHESGFTAISAGTLWKIKATNEPTPQGGTNGFQSLQSANAQDVKPAIDLPRSIADQLNEVNRLQKACDKIHHQIEADRKQLFADWYKYMLSTYHPEDANRGDDYPNVDEVRFFIEQKDIEPLERKIELEKQLNGDRTKALNDLDKQLAKFNKTLKESHTNQATHAPHYQREATPAPRYWQPAEPVILMEGDGIETTQRHGQDGRLSEDNTLKCAVLALAEIQSLFDQTGKVGTDFSQGIRTVLDQKSFAFGKWESQPWNPIMLEWEVELLPIDSKTNQTGSGYAIDAITGNYELYDSSIDLEIKPNRRAIARGPFYSNRCILSSHSSSELKQRIEAYLQKNLFDTYYEYQQNKSAEEGVGLKIKNWYEGKDIPPSKPTKWYTDDKNLDIASIKSWYEKKPTFPKEDKDEQVQDPIYIAIRAYDQLFEDQNGTKQLKTFLSQSLGGFNEELLMRKQTLQLPIEDPLGFAEYRQFTDRVRETVADGFSSAPEPLNQFCPIRSGAMRITRLRLIDSFGQVREFNHERDKPILTPQRLTTPGSEHLVWMPPRLVQPARVDFRWLAAAEKTQEMNQVAVTNPICGWLVPNNLDNSLMVYASDGKALGFLRQQQGKITWQSAPGRNRELDEIPNLHLWKLIKHILEKDTLGTEPHFLDALIATVNQALQNIAPENFAQNQSLSLLMGRPMAVVRASLNLELQGQPAIHQGWHSFRLDLERTVRETDNFTRVQFPVRIGEYQQFNDGVVGYWIEAGDGYQDDKFYAPQVYRKEDASIHPSIQLQDKDERNPLNILQSIDSLPLQFTLLFDPRGLVHVTTGILPVKAIGIPAEQYAAALDTIAVTFLTTPILTSAKTRSVPLPLEPGFSWSWLEHQVWLEKQVLLEGLKAQQDNVNDQGQKIWDQLNLNEKNLWTRLDLVGKGWLQDKGNGEAFNIVPMGRRASEDINSNKGSQPDWTLIEDQVEGLFWTKLFATPTIDKKTFLKALAVQIWNHLLIPKIGWIKQVESEFRVVVEAERTVQELDNGFAEFSQDIEEILNILGNQPAFSKNNFVDAFSQSDRQGIWNHLITINLNNVSLAGAAWDFLVTIEWLQKVAQDSSPTDRAEVALKREKLSQNSEIDTSKFLRISEDLEFILTKIQSESSEQRIIERSTFVTYFCNYIGWLRPVNQEQIRYEVIPKDRRLPEDLKGDRFSALEDQIQEILDNESISIVPINPQAVFLEHQEIREGWLVLSQAPPKNQSTKS